MLSEKEKKLLEDVFVSTVLEQMGESRYEILVNGKLRSDLMYDFRKELDAAQHLPFEEAKRLIQQAAKHVAENELRRIAENMIMQNLWRGRAVPLEEIIRAEALKLYYRDHPEELRVLSIEELREKGYWKKALQEFESLKEPVKRGAVLHLLATKKYENTDEFFKALREVYGVDAELEQVKKIIKEEWRKKLRHPWLAVTSKDYIKKVLGVDPEDP
jgi:hypothetical protein